MSPLLLQWRGQAGGGWLLWGLPGAGDRRNSGQDGSGCTPNLSLPKKGVKPAGVMADPPPPPPTLLVTLGPSALCVLRVDQSVLSRTS